MLTTRRRLRAAQLTAITALAILLSACAPTVPGDTSGSAGNESGAGSGSDSGSTSGDGGDSSSGDSDFVVLSGTGTYMIPDEIPYGGYQLLGEPAAQPDGCTWSIRDADGGISFENTGPYVFITDITEAVTFVTDGCPDWEQFE